MREARGLGTDPTGLGELPRSAALSGSPAQFISPEGRGDRGGRGWTGARRTSALNQIAALTARLLGSAASQVSLLSDVQTVAGGRGLAPGGVGSQGPLEDSLWTG